jgi:hypothetical protein
MTWTSFHRRGDVLRAVIAAADARRDGVLPTDIDGVDAVFADERELLGALQLKWHTRLAGRIEREQLHQPVDLPGAVVRAWQLTAAELPGVRAVLDARRAEPGDNATAAVMRKSAAKEHVLLAVMAGLASATDDRAAAVGARLEEDARRTLPPAPAPRDADRGSLLDRLRAALVA